MGEIFSIAIIVGLAVFAIAFVIGEIRAVNSTIRLCELYEKELKEEIASYQKELDDAIDARDRRAE